MPLVSVITPASRGVKFLRQLLRDFKNQTFADMEHIIVFDGQPPADVVELMKNEGGPRTVFTSIPKDFGNMSIAPGTRPRNHGTQIAKGKYVCYFDDDDRARDNYVETLVSSMSDNAISVCQMTCQLSRMRRDGDPTKFVLVPEVGLPTFPIICHFGTPCVMLPRQWALDNPWQHEPEHDYRFIKRLVEKYKPEIRFTPGMVVDVDSQVVGTMRDWVSRPPFFRGL